MDYRSRLVRKFIHCFGAEQLQGKAGESYSWAFGTSFSVPTLLLSMLAHLFLSSSLSLYYFVPAVPMRKCLEKHLCMSSPFPIAILNGTCVFQLHVHKRVFGAKIEILTH